MQKDIVKHIIFYNSTFKPHAAGPHTRPYFVQDLRKFNTLYKHLVLWEKAKVNRGKLSQILVT